MECASFGTLIDTCKFQQFFNLKIRPNMTIEIISKLVLELSWCPILRGPCQHGKHLTIHILMIKRCFNYLNWDLSPNHLALYKQHSSHVKSFVEIQPLHVSLLECMNKRRGIWHVENLEKKNA